MANKITVTSAGTVVNANVTPDSAMYYSNKSKEWAISDKIVDNTDYSSKYYANESKKQADISTAKTTEVVESGNTAISNIESARDNAITDIINRENVSIENVNTAGATQVSSVNTAGITQVANVNSAGTTQINLAKEQVTLATNQANIATEQATIATNKTSEVVASGNTALSNIDTYKDNALTDITDLKNTSISNMNTAKNEALTEIETLHSSSVTDITNLKDTSVSNITTAKNNAITSITTQETTSKNNVTTTGNEQVERVNLTGVDNRTPIFSKSEIGTNEGVYQNVYDLKHSTFDLSKFTVVGSPTITDDGVASGFDNRNYFRVPQGVFSSSLKPFKFIIQFTWVKLEGTAQALFQITGTSGWYNYMYIGASSAHVLLEFSDGSHQSLEVTNLNIDSGNTYRAVFEWTGNSYTLSVYNAENSLIASKSIESSLVLNSVSSSTVINIGRDWNSNYYSRGSIDLKHFSITADGKEVFNGNKTGLDVIKPDNYEVVGSPVISDDGVAGGWSEENYITIPDLKLQNAKTWKIEGVVDIKSAQTEGVPCWLSIVQGKGLMLPIWSDDTYVKFQLYLSSSTSEWNIATTGSSGVLLSEGSTFKCELEFSGTQYIYTIYQVATGRKVAVLTADSSDKVYQSPTRLGIKRNTHPMASDNTIDLNAFKIYVNGNLVYQPCLKIPYTQSKTGSKIVDVAYRDRVIDLYEQEGQAGYYTIDEPNKNFTLPMGEIYGMKANSDLSNLTTAGEKHFLNKSQITNCLREVPRRIKLELNDGVLTLKAGSQVIVPNGFEADGTTPKFDYVTIESDKTISKGHNTSDLVWYDGRNGIDSLPLSVIYSGSTAPSDNQYMLWYDTTNNQIKYTNNSGASWSAEQSFPLGVISTSSSAPTSIDQVFNGMGYIGSTIWVDKGVKGLIPNGRNADGSLINEEVTTDKLYTLTRVWGTSSRLFGYELSDGTDIIPKNHLIADSSYMVCEQPVMPTGTIWKWIDTANNQVWFKDENATSAILQKPYKIKNMFLGELTTVDGKITSFTPKLPFRAADENDIDGRWMRQPVEIINGDTVFPLGSKKYRDYDISNYLPNDGHIYELAVEIIAFSGSSTNATSHWWVSDSLGTYGAYQTCSCGGKAYSNSRDEQYANGRIPMAGRTLRLWCSSAGTAPTIRMLKLCGYRKVR